MRAYHLEKLYTKEEILELDFNFDAGYMFNDMFVSEDNLFFVDHLAGEGKDLIYVNKNAHFNSIDIIRC